MHNNNNNNNNNNNKTKQQIEKKNKNLKDAKFARLLCVNKLKKKKYLSDTIQKKHEHRSLVFEWRRAERRFRAAFRKRMTGAQPFFLYQTRESFQGSVLPIEQNVHERCDQERIVGAVPAVHQHTAVLVA